MTVGTSLNPISGLAGALMHESVRFGGEERRLMHLVPAPAVRLMKSRVLSRPGVNSLVHKNSAAGLAVTSSFSQLLFDFPLMSKESLARRKNYETKSLANDSLPVNECNVRNPDQR